MLIATFDCTVIGMSIVFQLWFSFVSEIFQNDPEKQVVKAQKR